MSSSPKSPAAPGGRQGLSRVIATLALFVISAAAFCAIAGTVLVRQADDRQEGERRAALTSAINEVRASEGGVSSFDPRLIRWLERIAGLKNLRFEPEPQAAGEGKPREMQSVLDSNGRIVGWFSWDPDRSMTDALRQLWPLLAVTGTCLIGFAVIALWQVRRAMRALSWSEQRAWKLAHEDMLTGLPNHRKMTELIDAAMTARADKGIVTLAYVDLDGLNDVNDAHGRATGDELLVAWATRMKDALPNSATGGRCDGDEFVVLITGTDAADAENSLRAMAATLTRPFWIGDKVIQLGNTVGFAHVPIHAQTRDDLTRRAALALRSAKRKLRGGVLGFERTMNVELSDLRFMERELKRALTHGGIDVHYQPIVTADGARIVGAEALARWQHPERGAIPPTEFVAAAEQAGLMSQLGAFVLRRALNDARRWPDLSIAVNLSPVQVRDKALVQLVSDLLAESGVAPKRLLLEVTEGVLIDNPEEARERLDALHALGVRLAIDDFGTGYSNLTYLQKFRFDKLKMDKSFVAPLARSTDSQAMVQAIVALGRALGLTLLAEGVETEEQRVLLRLAGCEEMQGFLFARPAPREALDKLLADARTQRVAV